MDNTKGDNLQFRDKKISNGRKQSGKARSSDKRTVEN
jgi:hypothetical protein